jgi:hypothetical protein
MNLTCEDRSWRWIQYILGKRWYPPTRLHRITARNTTICTFAALKTSNLVRDFCALINSLYMSWKHSVYWTIVFHERDCRLQQPAYAASSLEDFSILRMEAIRSPVTSVHTRSTQHHIPEDGILQSHRREKLNSYKLEINCRFRRF